MPAASGKSADLSVRFWASNVTAGGDCESSSVKLSAGVFVDVGVLVASKILPAFRSKLVADNANTSLLTS